MSLQVELPVKHEGALVALELEIEMLLVNTLDKSYSITCLFLIALVAAGLKGHCHCIWRNIVLFAMSCTIRWTMTMRYTSAGTSPLLSGFLPGEVKAA